MGDTKNNAAQVDAGIVEMWRKDGRLYAIAGFLIGLMVFPLLARITTLEETQKFFDDLVPEAVGILVTIIVIDRLNQRRDERNVEESLKRQLVMDAGSLSNEVAKNAVHQMRRKLWLKGEGGLLRYSNMRGADLHKANLSEANLQSANLNAANLQNANLSLANLQWTDLSVAKLQDAHLSVAKLQGASLTSANLQGANLNVANLSGANLRAADLHGAYLRGANLSGVNLSEANLQGASLSDAIFDEKTKMPDGSFYKNEKTNIDRFTDAGRQDFWRSNNKYSPAYGGKSEG